MENMKKYRLGIALGGGGAKGFAHLGVLRALEEFGLKPDIIAGCSAGSIVGSFYAAGFACLLALQRFDVNFVEFDDAVGCDCKIVVTLLAPYRFPI